MQQKAMQDEHLQSGPETVNGITFKPAPFREDLPSVRLWSVACCRCKKEIQIGTDTVESVRDGTEGFYRLATMKEVPPYEGYVCSDCDAAQRREDVAKGIKLQRPCQFRPDEIGTARWFAVGDLWSKRGMVDVVLRLFEQERVTRAKALELLEYVMERRTGGEAATELPRAPWGELNWAPKEEVDQDPSGLLED